MKSLWHPTLHLPSTQTPRSYVMLFFGGFWIFSQWVPSIAYSLNLAKYFWFTGRQLSSHSASSRKKTLQTRESPLGILNESRFHVSTFDVWLPVVCLTSEWLIIKLVALLRSKVYVWLWTILNKGGQEWERGKRMKLDLCDNLASPTPT